MKSCQSELNTNITVFESVVVCKKHVELMSKTVVTVSKERYIQNKMVISIRRVFISLMEYNKSDVKDEKL